MKVKIEFTLDIDPERWTLNYGIEGDKAIRDDVKGFVESTSRTTLQSLGLLEER